MFEGLKIRLAMWLMRPPKPFKIRKNTMCQSCGKKHATISDKWFMHGLPFCDECYNIMRLADYNLSVSMGDFDWIDDYNNIVESCYRR